MAKPSDDTKKKASSMFSRVGKSALGGAKKVASSVGKLFTKKPENVIPHPSGPTETLGEIFKMMKLMDKDRKLNQEMASSYIEEQKHEKDRRNNEIIKALTARKPPKPPKVKKEKKVEEKKVEEKKPEEKKPEEKKPEEKKPSEKKEPEKKVEEKKPPEKKAKESVEKVKEEKKTKETAEKTKEKETKKTKESAEKVKQEETKKSQEAAKTTAKKEEKPSILPSVGKAAAVTAAGVFASSQAFASTMYPYAKQASEKLGGKIPPEAILGQWAGESSSGKSVSAPFNYAGIKAGKNDKKGDYVLTEERYTDKQIKQAEAAGETLYKVLGPADTITKKGRQVTVDEWFGKGSMEKAASEGKKWVQVKSYFAKFDNFEEFTDRYVQFLSSDRYKKARESNEAGQFGLEVAKAGYATASADKYSQHIAEYAKNYNSGEKINQSSKENADGKKELNTQQAQSQQNINVINQNTNQTEQKIPDKPNDTNPLLAKVKGQPK